MHIIYRMIHWLCLTILRLILGTCLWNSWPIRIRDDFIPNSSYDFVVVGSGAGGSVVAGRLAETGAEVLLLEAGAAAPMESAVAGAALSILDMSYLWNIKTELISKDHVALNNRMDIPVAKALGGGTSINALIYSRGNIRDYDNWARLGNTGWDYESVLPYFKKSEDYRGIKTAEKNRYHGRGGPLPVEPLRFHKHKSQAFFKAGSELGYKNIDDSASSQIGFANCHYTVNNGLRASTSEAFLRPNLHRANLHIRTEAMVTKIIFNYAKRAVGVSYDYKGKNYIVGIRKEVVVSAGAVLTPKLLMLSGVGPKEHLNEMNIPVVADLEGVGQNLQDHPVYRALSWEVKSCGIALNRSSIVQPYELLQYLKDRTGIYSQPIHTVGIAWLHVGNDSSTDGTEIDDPEWADTELMLSPMSQSLEDSSYVEIMQGMQPEAWSAIFGPLIGKEAITIGHFLSRPKSRGWVKLNSTDPYDNPLVNSNIFDNPYDLETTVKGIRQAFKIAATKTFRVGMGAKFRSKPIRQCAKFVFDSDDYWQCHVRNTVITGMHFAGTARMGPPNDPGAVVTSRLRLRGVSGVRVVDASIMPTIVTGHLMTAVIMIGEKGADFIKEDWGYPIDPLT